jgi:predicted CopG family antitoxin
MHGLCMATKTISIDLSAYERLTMARNHERESFSKVIKRALWPKSRPTGKGLLDALESMPRASSEVIHVLDANQSLDLPPSDKWA